MGLEFVHSPCPELCVVSIMSLVRALRKSLEENKMLKLRVAQLEDSLNKQSESDSTGPSKETYSKLKTSLSVLSQALETSLEHLAMTLASEPPTPPVVDENLCTQLGGERFLIEYFLAHCFFQDPLGLENLDTTSRHHPGKNHEGSKTILNLSQISSDKLNLSASELGLDPSEELESRNKLIHQWLEICDGGGRRRNGGFEDGKR